MLSCAVFEFLVHKKQLFCGPITLTSKALLDMAVGISFRKSKKWSKEGFQGGKQPKIKLLVECHGSHNKVFDATSSLTIKQPHFVKEQKGMFYDQVWPNSS